MNWLKIINQNICPLAVCRTPFRVFLENCESYSQKILYKIILIRDWSSKLEITTQEFWRLKFWKIDIYTSWQFHYLLFTEWTLDNKSFCNISNVCIMWMVIPIEIFGKHDEKKQQLYRKIFNYPYQFDKKSIKFETFKFLI